MIMKRINMKLPTMFFAASLVAMASCLASCGQDDTTGLPGGETGIRLRPEVALRGYDASTRAGSPGATGAVFMPGGEILLQLTDETAFDASLQRNRFAIDEAGKLVRLKYDAAKFDTPEDLYVSTPGSYPLSVIGNVECRTDNAEELPFATVVASTTGQAVTIGADGRFTLGVSMAAAGIRVNIYNDNGTPYSGKNVSVSFPNLTGVTAKVADAAPGIVEAPLEALSVNSARPSAICGKVKDGTTLAAGAVVMELAVEAGNTFQVVTPKALNLVRGKLYTFNVHLGATEAVLANDVTVSSYAGGAISWVEKAPLMKGIYSVDDLKDFRDAVNAGESTARWDYNGTVSLRNDLDLSGEDWTSIGTADRPFTGKFNGNGYLIRNITAPLFGYVDGAWLYDVQLRDCAIDKRIASAPLVNVVRGTTYVVLCGATGSVTAPGAGGLLHTADTTVPTSLTIDRCWSTCNVTSSASWSFCGGLMATLENSGTNKVYFSYATGDISGYNCDAGGLFSVVRNATEVAYCYATGNVSTTRAGLAFIREFSTGVTLKCCYATGSSFSGSFVSNNGGTLINCVGDAAAVDYSPVYTLDAPITYSTVIPDETNGLLNPISRTVSDIKQVWKGTAPARPTLRIER